MKQINKSIVAAAVTMAIAGTASAATLDQFRMGSKVSVFGGDRAASLQTAENDMRQPSAFLVQLNAQPTSYALSGNRFNAQQAQQLTQRIEDVQQQVSSQLMQLDTDAKILGSTKHLASSIIVQASTKALESLSKNPAVVQILPIYDSKPLVAASQEYINAKSVVDSGVATGDGIKVAILDTGIDYTHQALGGAGTAEAYAAAFANQSGAVSWPQGSVVGGFDFVANDPNPIDDVAQGHGTSVAHSVNGIAPDVSFYGYRVCAPAPVNCTGVAQINALEASMDPNGDGDLSDRVDVINMSLGGDYGSTDTSGGTQLLIQRAVELGVSMVISAGNDGPNPFIVGGPSTTPNALSVGAMTHPTQLSTVVTTSTLAGETVDMIGAGFNPVQVFSFSSTENELVYITDNPLACDAFAEDLDLTGKTVMVDRGACNFTQKVLNAQARGAVFVIIANNAAGAGPVSAGGSAPGITIPAVGISLEAGMAVKELLAAGTAVSYEVVSESFATPGAIAGFTSRGPSMDGLLKPEITAPGTSIMVADVGTGDKLAPATGTSFSGPITAGAMSLLREARPELTAFEAKAVLMNTANMNVTAEPKALNPQAALAPISAMGAGLVDVAKAVSSPAVAWVYDAKFDTKQAALSFGLQTMTQPSTLTKTVTLKNFSDSARTYTLSIQDRFASDTNTGALSWNMPQSVQVGAGQTVQFDVSLTVNPAKLHEWELANGSEVGEKNDLLTVVEYDGALVLNDGTDASLHLVYHILPKGNADLKVRSEITDEGIKYVVRNDGAIAAEPFAAQLVGTSAKDAVPQDLRAATLDVVPVDFCSSGYLLVPSFTVDQPLSHTVQANFTMVMDNDNDGQFDFEVMSLLLSRLSDAYPTGYVGSFAVPYGTLRGMAGEAYHVSGQRNIMLTACMEDVGLSAADIGRDITVAFLSFNDGYNLGYANRRMNFDDVIVTTATLALSPEVALTDANGEPVSTLGAGESADLSWNTRNGFVLLSDAGDAIAVADINEGDKAPVITADQMFSVTENSANGTVIGKVDADVDFSSPVSEFMLAGSTSTAVTVQSNGDIVVADSALLNFDAGLTEIKLEVLALDTKGNVSAPASVMVKVLNIADEAPTVSVALSKATVDVGTASGTKLGDVSVSVKVANATVAEVTTNNNLFSIVNNQLVLARVPTKADAKEHSIVVTVKDSAGMSASSTVTVKVNKPSSGSFGWFSLLALPLLLVRRRRG